MSTTTDSPARSAERPHDRRPPAQRSADTAPATIPTHHLVVRLARAGTISLLSVTSVLHRRGIEVASAHWRTLRTGGASWTATVLATEAQARTAVASLRNLVDVVDAELGAVSDRAASDRIVLAS